MCSRYSIYAVARKNRARNIKPITHRRRRRDETVELRLVGVGGVNTYSQLAHDNCRRIRSTIWKLARQNP